MYKIIFKCITLLLCKYSFKKLYIHDLVSLMCIYIYNSDIPNNKYVYLSYLIVVHMHVNFTFIV